MLPISGIEEAPEIALRRRAHSGLVDKPLGLRVDGGSGAAGRPMDLEGAPHPKALAVPVRVGDQVDRDVDAERASEFERLEIEPERHALAVFLQPVFVDGFEPEEYVGHPESLPEPEYLLIAQQNVAAGFQVIALLYAGPGDCLAKRHP